MSVPLELLRVRQKRLILQRRQLEMEIEAAQLEEEILLSAADPMNVSNSGAIYTQQAENAVYNAQTANGLSQDLPETRGGGQDEERMYSTNAEVDNMRMPMVADSRPFDSNTNFATITNANEVHTSHKDSRGASTETIYAKANKSSEFTGPISNAGIERSQPQTLIAPTPKSFQASLQNDNTVNAGAANTQQMSPIPRPETKTPSYFGCPSPRTHFSNSQDGKQYARDPHAVPSPVGSTYRFDQSLASSSPQRDNVRIHEGSTPVYQNLPTQAIGPEGAIRNPSSLQSWQSQQTSSPYANTRPPVMQYHEPHPPVSSIEDVAPEVEAHTGASATYVQDRPVESGQFSFTTTSQQEIDPALRKNIKAISGGSLASAQSQGLGNCALKKKQAVLRVQDRQPASQVLVEGQDEVSRTAPKSGVHNTKTSRKRSSSITITNARPAKRVAGEDARVVTPPLNEDGEKRIRESNTEQRPAVRQPQQQEPQSRSPSGSQYSDHSSETSSNDSQVESDDLSDTAGQRPEQRQKRKTSMHQRIFPQITAQAYTLHLQGRSHEYNTSSLIYPPPHPSPHPMRPTGPAQLEIMKRPADHQQGGQRSGAPHMLASSNQRPRYRRLTPPERYELELRYCAHLARLLCSNTCVSSPPEPLCDENLWSRLHRRFPPQPGRPLPVRFSPDEVYTNAADFEVDVKAMLRQYVVLGHCGEQVQNQGEGRAGRVMRCEFEKTGNARVMCWRMRLESILDEKLRQLKPILRECEENYEGDDMAGKRACIDDTFAGVALGD